jgi:hypothetical protein
LALQPPQRALGAPKHPQRGAGLPPVLAQPDKAAAVTTAPAKVRDRVLDKVLFME